MRTHIVFLNSANNQTHSKGNTYNNSSSICQKLARTWMPNYFFSSCLLKATTDFFLLHSQVWQMFHIDNGRNELAIGWNSTELGDLLLKGKFVNFQSRQNTHVVLEVCWCKFLMVVCSHSVVCRVLICVLLLHNMTTNLPLPSAYTAKFAQLQYIEILCIF